jgi:hypothetical protein
VDVIGITFIVVTVTFTDVDATIRGYTATSERFQTRHDDSLRLEEDARLKGVWMNFAILISLLHVPVA